MADTLVLGTSASAWGFKSLYPHQLEKFRPARSGGNYSWGAEPYSLAPLVPVHKSKIWVSVHFSNLTKPL